MDVAESVAVVEAGAKEPVRLVIWDLDDTFWSGTLSEGGLAWSEKNADTVRELSRRGIINSICSKNDIAPVEAVLDKYSIREHFVFASVSWESKGPRLAALAKAVQLRPQSIMFIDDNPLNRAEAAHFVPGLQIEDETIVPHLLEDPRFKGKPDPDMSRLAQYRLLEQRQAAMDVAAGDTTAFLRDSGITVTIEYDLEPHIDRAVELINRTNQLNFTKARLPENPQAARKALKTLLGKHRVQAGIVHVRDNYGDYGYCGIYVARFGLGSGQAAGHTHSSLLHFAFSCRILGMGIETWLYQRLERPALKVVGEVLTDVINDERTIDWITVALPGVQGMEAEKERPLDYVLARGSCDLRAIGHYFSMVSHRVIEEFSGVRDGQTSLTSSSVIAAHAIRGTPDSLIRDSALFGFIPEDFDTLMLNAPAGQRAIWLLSFTQETEIPLLRHKATGALMPAWISGRRGPPAKMLVSDPIESGLAPALLDHLRKHFEMVGLPPADIFSRDLRLILEQAPAGVRIFIMLANEQTQTPEGMMRSLPLFQKRNALIREVAAAFPAVELIVPGAFMSEAELARLENPHHYDRIVYFRIFQHIMARYAERAVA